METLVISREILPETIFSFVNSEKTRVFKENDNVILSPFTKKSNINDLFGKYDKLSTEEFIRQKAIDKEFEN